MLAVGRIGKKLGYAAAAKKSRNLAWQRKKAVKPKGLVAYTRREKGRQTPP
jgi:hypothetical protein